VGIQRHLVDERPDQRGFVQRMPTCRLASAAATRGSSTGAMDSCTISRRSVVQRWPAVPAAEDDRPSASSRSADGVTIIPLLPPSSSRQRPKRAATRGASVRPIAVEPVADSSATSG
jgi:hypothetical protein